MEEFESAIGKSLGGHLFGEGVIGLWDDFGANGGGGNFLQRGGVWDDDFGSYFVTEVIGLAEEIAGVVFLGEFFLPPVGIAASGGEKLGVFFRESEDFGAGLGLVLRGSVVLPSGELSEVVRAACFGTGADGGSLPSAEGLAVDDGSGDGAVDVGVADFDGFAPLRNFFGVERMNASG